LVAFEIVAYALHCIGKVQFDHEAPDVVKPLTPDFVHPSPTLGRGGRGVLQYVAPGKAQEEGMR